MSSSEFLKAGTKDGVGRFIRVCDVVEIFILPPEQVTVKLTVKEPKYNTVTLTGAEAIRAIMLLHPNALEGKRWRWNRWVWSFHNLVGHPVMQILCFFKFYKLAFRVHDGTVPQPKDTTK